MWPLPLLCEWCGTESAVLPTRAHAESAEQGHRLRSLADDAPALERAPTGVELVDRFLSGGPIVGSSTTLYGGPGAGKSTLALQLVAGVAMHLGAPALIVCPEMSHALLAATARAGGADPTLCLRSETPAEWETEAQACGARVLLVDSISRMVGARLHLARAIEWARERHGWALLLAHRSRRGKPLGPVALEHDPDGVLYLEHRKDGARVLHAEKFRGGTDGASVTLSAGAAPTTRKRARASTRR